MEQGQQFRMQTNIKSAPGSQGTLFSGGQRRSTAPAANRPLPDEPAAQVEARQTPDFMDHRRQMLDVAKRAEPGTRIYRGEHDRYVNNPRVALERHGVGMHWSATPDMTIRHGSRKGHSVVWEGVVDKPGQTIGRGHGMWSGQHISLDSEAEIRFRPGKTVRVTGAHVWTGDPRNPGTFAPGTDRHDSYWEHHPLDVDAPVKNKGGIDYSDSGIGGQQKPRNPDVDHWLRGQEPLFYHFPHEEPHQQYMYHHEFDD